MPDLEPEQIMRRLMAEFGYSEDRARMVAWDLTVAVPPVRDAFLQWWTAGVIPDLEIEGYSLQRLIDDHSLQPIGAFLTLDWLATEPHEARRALTEGYDVVQ